MKRTFRKGHWARQSIMAQNASNVSGLLHSAAECIKDWRASADGEGDFNGKKCIPLRLIMFQVLYLTGMSGGIAFEGKNYPADEEFGRDYASMQALYTSIDLDAEAVEHFISAKDIKKAITYYAAPLTEEQTRIFKEWARDNYNPEEPMDNYWHPVVKTECEAIRLEYEETARQREQEGC
jgi:hypothetical protein